MKLEQVLHMNGGEGETSYAYNSTLQKTVISKVKPVLEEAIQNLCKTNSFHCLRVADLGCSSGPNTLLVITEIIDITYKASTPIKPSFQVFLNDLPQNDFNSIFRSLPSFFDKLKKERGDEMQPCFITGVPGSFYNRLFPSNTLDFVHSSYSLHWLSQVPQGLESEEGIPLNKGNIYIARTSPPIVPEAYRKQFKMDFSSFLTLRANELIPGGRMLLTIMGRKSEDPFIDESWTPWKLLASILGDMVREGLVEEYKLDSFNMPFYTASANEIKEAIQAEGSFNIHRLELFEVDWEDTADECEVENVASCIRAVSEPMLVSHFGETIMEDLFHRFTVKATERPFTDHKHHVDVVVSLTNKV